MEHTKLTVYVYCTYLLKLIRNTCVQIENINNSLKTAIHHQNNFKNKIAICFT